MTKWTVADWVTVGRVIKASPTLAFARRRKMGDVTEAVAAYKNAALPTESLRAVALNSSQNQNLKLTNCCIN